MKRVMQWMVALALLSGLTQSVSAMPPAQMKQILNMTKSSWVSFRDYNGRQLIYFTHLESYTCGIMEVRYSINSDALDKVWPLQPCDPNNPMAVTKEQPYLSLPLGTAQSIAVQVTFKDGAKSDIVQKRP